MSSLEKRSCFECFSVDLHLSKGSLTFMDLHLIKSKTDQKLHKNHSEKKFPILCVYRQTASPMCQKYANDVLISPQGLIIHWLRTKLNKTRNGMFDFSFRGWHHNTFSCARVCVSRALSQFPSLPERPLCCHVCASRFQRLTLIRLPQFLNATLLPNHPAT